MTEDDEIGLDTPVTTVIRQRPLRHAIARYEAWLKEIIPVAQGFTGHQGVNVIRPHAASEPYAIILHFDTVANLRRWLDSDMRVRLVEQIRPFLDSEENVDIKTGFEFWFTPQPAVRSAKPYKQFAATLSVIFPLTIIVPLFLRPAFDFLPVLGMPFLRQFIIAAIIVGLMVYVIMPRYTRALAKWLFR